MRGERAGVVSETKPPPGHAIFAQPAQADVCSAGPERRKTDTREEAANWGCRGKGCWGLKTGPCNYKQH